MTALRFLTLCVFFVLCACSETEMPPVSEFEKAIEGFEKQEGFFDVYTNEEEAKIFAILPAPDADGVSLRVIHAMRLTSGLGSNPIGLDRGWGNSGTIVRFRQIGDKVIAEVENHRYRASADNPLEKKAVADSFARSFIWSEEVIAQSDDGELLVDMSSLLTTDFLGLAAAMAEEGAGFTLAKDRTLPNTKSALVFPDNVELEAYLTFTSSKPGPEIRATAPYPNAVTLVTHHSFVRLPDDQYNPRKADPRVGTFTLGFYDYSAPLEGQVLQSYAMRHRLQREEPGNPDSPIVKPIVFYVDPGAPEQIREALVDGASWWADAFAEAGLEGGYRVELLPETAHPLDIRYNVIQWVHRQTRGWSYGGGIIDPRTGEFLKGHVILGSQRVRQDRMIFEGLAGVEKTGTGLDDDPVELSLDRIRQLSAHEVAHALGFGHNFAASTNNRASVTDYPAPWVVAQADGTLDFSKAYDEGIGEWDIATVKWLYGEYTDEEEAKNLDHIIQEARGNGLRFIADQHGRPVGGAHHFSSVWDNGNDPVAELENVMKVRKIALENFDTTRLAEGRPHAALREVLTPIYLYHRYQINAASKPLGGVTFQYGKNGQDIAQVTRVSAMDQRAAFDGLLNTLRPAALDIPQRVREILEPATDPYWFRVPSESLASRTTPVFDFAAAVETSADLTFKALFNVRRAERLVQQNVEDDALLSLDAVIAQTEEFVFRKLDGGEHEAYIAQLVKGRFVVALINLETEAQSQTVKASARAGLVRLEQRLLQKSDVTEAETNHNLWLADQISAHLQRPAPELALPVKGLTAPPGSPIGTVGGMSIGAYEDCWHCE